MNTGALLIVAALSLMAAGVSGRSAPRFWLTAMLAGLGIALAVALAVLAGGAPWDWHSHFLIGGERVHVQLDAIGALFLALLGVVGGAATLYAREYWTDASHPGSAGAGRAWWAVLLLTIGLVIVASNGLHFLIAWEIFTLSAYYLITLDRQRAEVRSAGWLYLGASHVSMVFLFAFFALLAVHTGTWELAPLRELPEAQRAELAPLFWLALAGFGLKAGMFPLHVWLPSAHANAPSHVSAVLSGVTIKLGIFGLVRFSGWLPVPDSAGWWVAMFGVASAVLGVAFALGQHDLKRLLAYHSVENIGIILIGLGFALIATTQPGGPAWGHLALAGGLLHVWNHGLFKALLFLGAGSVLHATGTREMSRLGGLWRAMPWTAGLFALGAMAISGLPPLNGFVSEWLVYLGLFDAATAPGSAALAAVPAIVLLAVTGALALACFVKVCAVVFLGAPRTASAGHAHECGLAMRTPMTALALACVGIGLAPFVVWPAIARAAAAWHPAWRNLGAPVSLARLSVAHLALAGLAGGAAVLAWRRIRGGAARRTVTWDCGYAAPSARMQYTAGSFAGIITAWFAWILRPARHEQRPEETFPLHASFASHTPETVLEHVIEPAGGIVMQLSSAARRLQHGRVQTYLIYLLFGVAGLAALIVSGDGF